MHDALSITVGKIDIVLSAICEEIFDRLWEFGGFLFSFFLLLAG
jgi:hypothetical protein